MTAGKRRRRTTFCSSPPRCSWIVWTALCTAVFILADGNSTCVNGGSHGILVHEDAAAQTLPVVDAYNEIRGGSTTTLLPTTSSGTTGSTNSSRSSKNNIHPWWQISLFQRRPKQKYRQALEEQIQWLEAQLRLVMDETLRLKTQSEKLSLAAAVATTTTALAFSRADRQRLAQTLQLRQQHLEALQEQLTDLTQAKQALEDLLQEQQRQMDHLEEQCQQVQYHRREMQAEHQAQVDELTARIHQRTLKQLAEIDQLWNDKLQQQAQQTARQDVWREGKERLAKLAADLEDRFQDELNAERLQTQQAIEAQRQKMRSLAKATAIREQTLFYDDHRERQRKATLKRQEQRQIQEKMEQTQARLAQETKVAKATRTRPNASRAKGTTGEFVGRSENGQATARSK